MKLTHFFSPASSTIRTLRRFTGCIAFAAVFLIGAGQASAQIITFQAPESGNNLASQDPSAISANLTVDGLQRINDGTVGGNVLFKTSTAAWGQTHWASQPGSGAYLGSRSDTGYVFTLSAAEGYTFDVSSVTFLHRATAAGPGTVGIKIAGTEYVGTGTSVSSSVGTYDSGALTLTGLTSATFIVQGWDSGGTGSGEFQMNNLQVFGSVNPIAPPPSDNNSVLSTPSSLAFGRVMSGSTEDLTVSNTGDATTFNVGATGGFIAPGSGSVTEDGTSDLTIGVGTDLGERTGVLTVTNTAADSAGPGQGSDQSPQTTDLSATVVENRQIGATFATVPVLGAEENVIDVGRVLVGVTASGTGIVATSGSDDENTRITLNANQTIEFITGGGSNDPREGGTGVYTRLDTGETPVLFNSDGSTAVVTGEAAYGTSGVQSTNFANLTSSSGAITGEGLAGESTLAGRVYFQAEVYEAADIARGTGQDGTLGVGDTVSVTNASADGDLRAAAEVVSIDLTGDSAFGVDGISVFDTVAAGGSVSGTVTFSSAGRLNGTYLGSAVMGFQHADQSITGTSENDLGTITWNFSATVTDQTGGGVATVADGQSYDSFNTSRGSGNDTSVNFLGGEASGSREIEISFSDGVAGTFSDIVTLNGTGSDRLVLQLSYNPALLDTVDPETLYLGWEFEGSYINAVIGNSDNDVNLDVPFLGSWDDYLAAEVGRTLENSLGAFGVDVGDAVVWAVIDHNSNFAAIPEPELMVGVMAMLALVGGLYRRWRRMGA